MTAERCYVDSSALRHLYAHDVHSHAMAAWRYRTAGSLGITRFGRTELINAMALAVFRQDITPIAHQAFQAARAKDFLDGDLRLVDVSWRVVLDQAAELSRQHTPRLGTRSLDVLHVASALEMNARHFITYDDRQAGLAALCGLKAIRP